MSRRRHQLATALLAAALVGVPSALGGHNGVTAIFERTPDTNGWYNAAIKIDFSGPEGYACDPAQTTYSGPDSTAATVATACTHESDPDLDHSFGFMYDATDPSVTVAGGRSPDHNGWYNRPVTFSAAATDTVSGVAGCEESVAYAGPETASGSIGRSCTDNAGNVGSGSASFKYDATPPTVVVSASRPPDFDGWYTRPVTFSAAASDNGPSGSGGCDSNVAYSGPEGTGRSVALSCSDGAGNSASDSITFKYDDTPPLTTITGKPADPTRKTAAEFAFTAEAGSTFECRLDAHPWSECTSPQSYSGLREGDHTFQVRATDRAGNDEATAKSHSWEIDRTPTDRVGNLRAKVTDVIGPWRVKLIWTNPTDDDLAQIVVRRRPGGVVFSGLRTRFVDRNLKPGVRYRYKIIARDRAGNKIARRIRVSEILLAPRDGAVLSRRPRLYDWQSIPNTAKYHFQLWRLNRRGALAKRVALKWPAASHVKVKRKLRSGRYGWWVWRVTGPQKFQLLGRSAFTKR